MIEKNREIRFGVLLDSFQVKKWQADCISELLKLEHVKLICFVKNDASSQTLNSKISIGYRILERSVRNKGPLKLTNIESIAEKITVLKVEPEKRKGANYFPEQHIKQLADLRLDFMLRFGFGILKGDILNVSKLGIWSFHHADVTKFRGGPTAFWDIYYNHPLNGAILQKINNKLDQGSILRAGYLKSVNHSFKHNLYKILEVSVSWPSIVIKDYILNGEPKSLSSPSIPPAPLYKVPSNIQVLIFCFKLFCNKVKFHWNQLMKAEFWNIGIVEKDIKNFVEEPTSKILWAPKPKTNCYRADPFGSTKNSKDIYFEKFDYKTFKGELRKTSFNKGVWGEEKKVFDAAYHQSYPFTIKHQGISYLIAESYQNGSITLREEDNQPSNELEILKGKWLDPSLIYHENKFWLFCTQKEYSNESLFLFYSDELKGPFTAHPLNPIVVDIRKARPAGTPFFKDGQWYRPAQDCSTTYGGAVQVMKIETISTTNYQESHYKTISPSNNGKYKEGLHTISAFGNYTLIDGKYSGFNLANFLHTLKEKLKRIF